MNESKEIAYFCMFYPHSPVITLFAPPRSCRSSRMGFVAVSWRERTRRQGTLIRKSSKTSSSSGSAAGAESSRSTFPGHSLTTGERSVGIAVSTLPPSPFRTHFAHRTSRLSYRNKENAGTPLRAAASPSLVSSSRPAKVQDYNRAGFSSRFGTPKLKGAAVKHR